MISHLGRSFRLIVALTAVVMVSSTSPIYAQTGWRAIANEQFMSAQAPGEDTYYVASNDGKILKTSDGGERWEYSLWDTTLSFSALSFSDLSHGVAIDYRGNVLVTSDEGAHWHFGSKLNAGRLYAALYSGGRVFVGGDGGVFMSTDHCETWKFLDLNLALKLRVNRDTLFALSDSRLSRIDLVTGTVERIALDSSVVFQDFAIAPNGFLFLIGNAGCLLCSGDGGRTLERLYSTVQFDLSSIDISRDGRLVATGFGKKAIVSISPFVEWHTQDLPKTYYPVDYRSVVLTSGGDVIIAGTSGTIAVRKDTLWHQLAHSPLLTSDNAVRVFFGIKFYNTHLGYAYENNGLVFRTLDGGVTWRAVEGENNTMGICDLDILDSLNAVCAGQYRQAMRTTNAGTSWQKALYVVKTENHNAIRFPFSSTQIGFLGSDSGISRSSDGGATWSKVYWDSTVSIRRLSFSANLAIAIGYRFNKKFERRAVLLRSADSGMTWTQEYENDHQELFDGVLVSGDFGMIVGYGGLVGRTSDSGKTWDTSSVGRSSHFVIYIQDSSRRYIFGNDAKIYRTSDGGDTWDLEFPHSQSMSGRRLLGAGARDSTALFAVGLSTMLVKYFGPSENAAVQDLPWSPNLYLYIQAYPSPASGNINIRVHGLYAVTGLLLRLKIYDVLGREVDDMSSAIEANRMTNTSEIVYNTSKLTPGSYTIVLGAGEYGQVRKIVIVK